MIVGATQMPIKKFITICSAIILPKTIFFMIVGYYFGAAYDMIVKRFEKGSLIAIIIIATVIAIYIGFNRLSAYIAKRIEKL
jgi:membrane protein DedA with SNARE-associated domain